MASFDDQRSTVAHFQEISKGEGHGGDLWPTEAAATTIDRRLDRTRLQPTQRGRLAVTIPSPVDFEDRLPVIRKSSG